MFTARPQGTTLRRVEEFIHRPHDPTERLDPDFRVAMRCAGCGKVGYGPRSQISEAIAEHQSQCEARKGKENTDRYLTRIFFPRA